MEFMLKYNKKRMMGMNIVIISGEIVSDIDFNFIYRKDKKEEHTSIAMGKLKLDNGSIIDFYGYDDIADILYRSENRCLWIEGKLDHHMMLEVLQIIYGTS